MVYVFIQIPQQSAATFLWTGLEPCISTHLDVNSGGKSVPTYNFIPAYFEPSSSTFKELAGQCGLLIAACARKFDFGGNTNLHHCLSDFNMSRFGKAH